MNVTIVWDAGESEEDRYTILFPSGRAFLIKTTAAEDSRNIESLSRAELDIDWMNSHYKSISPTELPDYAKVAIREKLNVNRS